MKGTVIFLIFSILSGCTGFYQISGELLGRYLLSSDDTYPIIYENESVSKKLLNAREINTTLYITNETKCPETLEVPTCYQLPVTELTTGSRASLIREFIKEYNRVNSSTFNYMVDLGVYDKDVAEFKQKRKIEGFLLDVDVGKSKKTP